MGYGILEDRLVDEIARHLTRCRPRRTRGPTLGGALLDGLGVTPFPLRPVAAVVILDERLHQVAPGIGRVDLDGVGIEVAADGGAPDLLGLFDARRVVQRVAEVVVNASDLAVVGELADDAFVEPDRLLEAGGELFGCDVELHRASALFVERGEAEHRVGRVLGVGVRTAVGRDELLEATDRLLARIVEAGPLDADLAVERREHTALSVFVVVLDDAGDRAAVVLRRGLVGLGLARELFEGGDLIGRGRRQRGNVFGGALEAGAEGGTRAPVVEPGWRQRALRSAPEDCRGRASAGRGRMPAGGPEAG
jgi:hypothetical protein